MAPDGTIVSCRDIERTGTRFPVKFCKSEAAWARFDKMLAEDGRAATDKVQRNGCAGTPGPCFPGS